MITHPHHPHLHPNSRPHPRSRTHLLDGHEGLGPSPKRKRDFDGDGDGDRDRNGNTVDVPPSPQPPLPLLLPALPARLQTTNLHLNHNHNQLGFSSNSDSNYSSTARGLADAATIDDGISPRALVSARFQGLNLNLNLQEDGSSPEWGSGERREAVSMSMSMSTSTSTSMKEGRGSEMRSRESSVGSVEVAETPEADSCVGSTSTTGEGVGEVEDRLAKHTIEQGMVEFKAGLIPATVSSHERPSASSMKRAKPADSVLCPPTSPKRQRQRQGSGSVSPSLTPVPRSCSPSARKLPNHKKRISESSSDDDTSQSKNTTNLSQFWWQDSEITGHDPADPDEDNRGINGVGYQKSRAEAWKIGQQRNKQLSDWRSREAKEARALRAGGRRTLMGRVAKSRSGSPVEVRGRLSPMPKSAVVVVEEEKRPKRGVRFEVG